MGSNVIFSFISNRLRSVERHLSGFKRDREIEHLHRLRVDIKKANAIFAFIEKIYEEKFDLTSLKSVFKKAGEIRECQINITTLSLLPTPPLKIIIELKKKKNSLQQKFIRDIPKYLQLVGEFRKNTFFSFKIPGKKIVKKYLNSKRKKAVRNFNSQDRSNMHRFRKLIKRMMYVYALLPEKTQKTVRLNKGLINKLQKEAGSWHDTYSTITFLSQKNFNQKAKYISILNQKEIKQFTNLFINYPDLKI